MIFIEIQDAYALRIQANLEPFLKNLSRIINPVQRNQRGEGYSSRRLKLFLIDIKQGCPGLLGQPCIIFASLARVICWGMPANPFELMTR
jgi:hypothetical protein